MPPLGGPYAAPGVGLSTAKIIGAHEALAVDWSEVDLRAGTVDVSHTLLRVAGVGLARKATKAETGERLLALCRFVISMLRRRNSDGEATGPVFPDTLGD